MPSVFRAFCQPRIGIRTSYRSARQLPPTSIDPFPKDGLAISGGVPLEPIETVKSSAPEWSAMASELAARVRSCGGQDDWRRAFDGALETSAPGHGHGTRFRFASNPGIARRATSRDRWSRISRLRVSIRPGRPTRAAASRRSSAAGCIIATGNWPKSRICAASSTYCDRYGVTYMLPFGRVRPNKTTYWVFQLSGWESEWYEVVATRRDSIRYALEVAVGGIGACRIPPMISSRMRAASGLAILILTTLAVPLLIPLATGARHEPALPPTYLPALEGPRERAGFDPDRIPDLRVMQPGYVDHRRLDGRQPRRRAAARRACRGSGRAAAAARFRLRVLVPGAQELGRGERHPAADGIHLLSRREPH